MFINQSELSIQQPHPISMYSWWMKTKIAAEWTDLSIKESVTKNENYVSIYLLSCHSRTCILSPLSLQMNTKEI